jgi:hypothetical protein
VRCHICCTWLGRSTMCHRSLRDAGLCLIRPVCDQRWSCTHDIPRACTKHMTCKHRQHRRYFVSALCVDSWQLLTSVQRGNGRSIKAPAELEPAVNVPLLAELGPRFSLKCAIIVGHAHMICSMQAHLGSTGSSDGHSVSGGVS